MIIQCEQCQTKFRLDDSRITDKGVKVRCAKCRHVFSVKSDRHEVEAKPDFGALLDQSALGQEPPYVSKSQDTNPAPDVLSTSENAPSGGVPDAALFDVPEDETSSVEGEASGSPDLAEDTMFSPDAAELKSEPVPAPSTIDDFSDFDFDDNNPFADTADFSATEASQAEPVPAPAATDDFSDFDFDDTNPFADAPPFSATETQQDEQMPAPAATDDFNGFDFDETNPFADSAAFPAAEATEPVPPAPADDFSDFDFENDDLFAAPVTEKPSASAGDELTFDHETDNDHQTASKFGTRSDDAFDFNDLQLSNVSDAEGLPDNAAGRLGSAPSQFSTPATVISKQSETEAEVAFKSEPDIKTTPQQEELPPLSVTTRRRQNPWITGAIAVIGVLIALGLAFYGYSVFLVDKGKGIQNSEKITIRSLDASFVKNPVAGDLLVITGEALNNFKKPRASIQVKGMVYGQSGQVMAIKNVYAGNPLTKDQLATMPLDKIEAVMSNQFGDSLVNLEVAPGKSIPFVIVIAQPPADAKDYGVEPAGSMVATTK